MLNLLETTYITERQELDTVIFFDSFFKEGGDTNIIFFFEMSEKSDSSTSSKETKPEVEKVPEKKVKIEKKKTSESSDSESNKKETKQDEKHLKEEDSKGSKKDKKEKKEKKDKKKKKTSDSSDDELNKQNAKSKEKNIKEEDSKGSKKDKKAKDEKKDKKKKKANDSSDDELNQPAPKPADKHIKDEDSKGSKKEKKKDKKKKKDDSTEEELELKRQRSSVEITDPVLLEKQERANKFFNRKKHRRLSSPSKVFIGDHLGVLEIPDIVETLNQFNPPEKLYFADHCTRLTNRNHMEDCSLLVTTNYMFILNNRLQHLLTMNPISIANIIKIQTSLETDNAVAFILPGYDSELIMSSFKIELMQIICDRYKELNGKELDIQFTNIIEFDINEDTIFEFDFVRATDGIRMTLFVKAKPKIVWSKRPN